MTIAPDWDRSQSHDRGSPAPIEQAGQPVGRLAGLYYSGSPDYPSSVQNLGGRHTCSRVSGRSSPWTNRSVVTHYSPGVRPWASLAHNKSGHPVVHIHTHIPWPRICCMDVTRCTVVRVFTRIVVFCTGVFADIFADMIIDESKNFTSILYVPFVSSAYMRRMPLQCVYALMGRQDDGAFGELWRPMPPLAHRIPADRQAGRLSPLLCDLRL